MQTIKWKVGGFWFENYLFTIEVIKLLDDQIKINLKVFYDR